MLLTSNLPRGFDIVNAMNLQNFLLTFFKPTSYLWKYLSDLFCKSNEYRLLIEQEKTKQVEIKEQGKRFREEQKTSRIKIKYDALTKKSSVQIKDTDAA